MKYGIYKVDGFNNKMGMQMGGRNLELPITPDISSIIVYLSIPIVAMGKKKFWRLVRYSTVSDDYTYFSLIPYTLIRIWEHFPPNQVFLQDDESGIDKKFPIKAIEKIIEMGILKYDESLNLSTEYGLL